MSVARTPNSDSVAAGAAAGGASSNGEREAGYAFDDAVVESVGSAGVASAGSTVTPSMGDSGAEAGPEGGEEPTGAAPVKGWYQDAYDPIPRLPMDWSSRAQSC